MKLGAIGVTSSDFKKSVQFYSLLGFEFEDFKEDEQHIEPKTQAGQCRLMIDSTALIKDILGQEPMPSNHSAFALEFSKPSEIDEICKLVSTTHFKVIKEPWDAFWGQRYAIVEDPDGYKIDLYCNLDK